MLGYRELRAQCSLYERTIWHVEGRIVLKGRVFIGRGSSLAVRGVCVFSDNFTISGRSSIICEDRVEFNKNVLMSWDVLIMDTDYHSILDITGRKINEDRSIIIGNNVWIGCRCTILKGSIIPDGCIISAGSIIAGILPKENAVYSSEKKVIKENITWLR